MISNSNFAGITDNSKPSSKVLRPPGGGTSDIFGGDLPQTPRNVKNHMQSNIFSCDKNGGIKNNVRQGAHRFYFIGDQPRRGQQKVDSYQRLFGEPERPVTPARNHMKSNIPFGSNTEAAQELLANGNGHHSNGKGGSVSTSTSSSVSSSTENLKMMNGVSKTVFRKMSNGNPVTGEGYKPSNSFNHSVPSLNGANQVINKNRIPPGGFSSGLW
ncbi:PREDICTED: microtubule-associated protein Jupiter-like isoform X1 [Rhagoletis zephyria]|uniref:microtubule-associated protein Jupiter-like isoform X1 n=1 Tax=Rhagoletis zephyria TaxID=28612 RepID=UPI00081152DE|nr:PREDICTED: microtubule-associated protein Jupiter-like isoform X1 [Rhagoletis zephyria]XP_036334123.1 microtubule-associated protein Jupiter isoform X2 [Rhagoletis pomonella]